MINCISPQSYIKEGGIFRPMGTSVRHGGLREGDVPLFPLFLCMPPISNFCTYFYLIIFNCFIIHRSCPLDHMKLDQNTDYKLLQGMYVFNIYFLRNLLNLEFLDNYYLTYSRFYCEILYFFK